MRIHYFIHITGTDTGVSGIPRVVKNLGRQLVTSDHVEFIPVCWSIDKQAVVHAPEKHLENFARHGGPELQMSTAPGDPVKLERGDWMLFAEVPHLHSYDPEYPSISIIDPIGYARPFGVRTAVILHDILPLTYRPCNGQRRALVDIASKTGDDGELDRLQFAVYAQAMVNVDVVLPVSQTTGTALADWLLAHGHPAERLPPIHPTLLPEEISGVARTPPRLVAAAARFESNRVSHNRDCVRAQNQLSTMKAFARLIARRPDLDLRFHVVGTVTPDCAAPASLIAKRSGGRIQLHGYVPDAELGRFWSRARASVFLSLAEGYGLPVAESMWRGIPCLCSEGGSIAEIARAGGCLTVDPRNLDEVEIGFETLASNSVRYGGLLKQIARRRMKGWPDYAAAVMCEIAAHSPDRPGSRPISDCKDGEAPAAGAPAQATEACLLSAEAKFVITVDDLKIRKEYDAGGGHPALRRDSLLQYTRDLHGSVPQRALFYGPYASLAPGEYAFTFNGEIDGEVNLVFTAEGGRRILEAVSLQSFAEPVRVLAPEATQRFEIVAKRTETLNRLMLRSIDVEFREFSAGTRRDGD